MRKKIIPLFLLFLPSFLSAQTNDIDSLNQLLQNVKKDTTRVILLNELSRLYFYSNPDTAFKLARQSLDLADNIDFQSGKAMSLNRIANFFNYRGNFPKALQLHLEALKIAESIKDEKTMQIILSNIGLDYGSMGNQRLAIDYTYKALMYAQKLDDKNLINNCQINLGDSYEKIDELDSAMFYTMRAYELAMQMKNAYTIGIALNNLGNIYRKLGRDDRAMVYYKLALPSALEDNDDDGLSEIYLGIATLFRKAGKQDSCVYYAKLALAHGKKSGFILNEMNISKFLTDYYTSVHNIDSAFAYQSAAIAARDSLFSHEKAQQIENITFDESMRQKQIEDAKQKAQTQMKFNALLGGLATVLIAAFLLYRNNLQKQKANKLLKAQKQEIENQRDQTNKALNELQQTQKQLVQSEKMASLGELTAGIAHEIQNPLNFVNNFSEVNKEMLEELKAERLKPNAERDDDLQNDLIDDVIANEEKINHHGKRADAIVKGMLQHSRKTEGVKEPTEINALCDEYYD